jgi:inner centromere protein with ARK binding domain
MYVSTVNAQHVQQTLSSHHNEMAKYASGRIPFADGSSQSTASGPHSQQQYKTPARNVTEAPTSVAPTSVAPSSAGPARSSPFAYPPPESVELPDIATDSEDEDPDKTPFKVPAWAESPALREALEAQQLKDPLKIFGPIPPLRMDEVFKNKDRQNKFRHRTSSANWSGTDKLTEEERKRDKRAREVLKRDGGWDMVSQKAAMGGSPFA